MTDTTFGSQVYGAHYHTWRSAVQLFGVLDGKHTILDGNYDFFKPYYEMVLNQEADGVCRKYTDLKTEGLHYSAAFSGGDNHACIRNSNTDYCHNLTEYLVRDVVRKVLRGDIICRTNTRNADRKSTRLNSSHSRKSRMPSSA